jgi:hypothetical protein
MTIQINGTSGITGVDGSAATPALQGSDTNTGLTFGTDTVGVVTGGTTRFQVGSAGQLGIGGATYGSSGQFLQSQGDSAAPQWATPASDTGNDYNFASGNANSSSHLVTGIPSDAVKIVINLSNVGWSLNSTLLFVRLGNSNGINTTAGGYTWSSVYTGTTTGSGTSDSSYILNEGFGPTTARIYGTLTLNRHFEDAWIGTYLGRDSQNANYVLSGAGYGNSGNGSAVDRLELAVNQGSMNTGAWNVNVFTE